MNIYIKPNDILQPYTANKFQTNLIEDWSKNKKIDIDLVEHFSDKVGGKVHLRIYPRRMVKTVWKFEKPLVPFPPKEYAFRAFARGSTITLLDDDTETRESLGWLLLHELAHVWVTRTPKLRKHFRSIEKPEGYLVSDAAHESSPEEQFANMMADQWFKDFYHKPGSYHRLWWRKQVLGR
jgi:hypothetical protein